MRSRAFGTSTCLPFLVTPRGNRRCATSSTRSSRGPRKRRWLLSLEGRPHDSPTRNSNGFPPWSPRRARRDHDESARGQHGCVSGRPGLGGVRAAAERVSQHAALGAHRDDCVFSGHTVGDGRRADLARTSWESGSVWTNRPRSRNWSPWVSLRALLRWPHRRSALEPRQVALSSGQILGAAWIAGMVISLGIHFSDSRVSHRSLLNPFRSITAMGRRGHRHFACLHHRRPSCSSPPLILPPRDLGFVHALK